MLTKGGFWRKLMEKSRLQVHNSHSPFLQGPIFFPTCCTYHCVFFFRHSYTLWGQEILFSTPCSTTHIWAVCFSCWCDSPQAVPLHCDICPSFCDGCCPGWPQSHPTQVPFSRLVRDTAMARTSLLTSWGYFWQTTAMHGQSWNHSAEDFSLDKLKSYAEDSSQVSSIYICSLLCCGKAGLYTDSSVDHPSLNTFNNSAPQETHYLVSPMSHRSVRASPVFLLLHSSMPGKEEPVLHLICSHPHFSIEFVDAGKKIFPYWAVLQLAWLEVSFSS